MSTLLEESPPDFEVDSAASAAAASRPRTIWQLLLHNPSVCFGGAVLAVMFLTALLAPFLGTIDPSNIDPIYRNKVPGTERMLRLEDGSEVPITHWM